MGVKVKFWKGKWWLFINHEKHRKTKCVGDDHDTALRLARDAREALARGDLNLRPADKAIAQGPINTLIAERDRLRRINKTLRKRVAAMTAEREQLRLEYASLLLRCDDEKQSPLHDTRGRF